MGHPTKVMNHSEYMKSLKNKSVEQLRFIIKDAREAINAYPENPNYGYYEDEIHYCCMELKNRG